MKTYLIEFISGLALMSPRRSRIQNRAEKYVGKNTLTNEEALVFAKESKVFYRSLRVNLVGVVLSVIFILAGTLGFAVGAIQGNEQLAILSAGAVGALFMLQIIITVALRKTHKGGIIGTMFAGPYLGL